MSVGRPERADDLDSQSCDPHPTVAMSVAGAGACTGASGLKRRYKRISGYSS